MTGVQTCALPICKAYAPVGENLTIAELEQKMREIDKNRAAYRSFLTDTKWGEKETYHLCINTSTIEIKRIVPYIAAYVNEWFKQKQA